MHARITLLLAVLVPQVGSRRGDRVGGNGREEISIGIGRTAPYDWAGDADPPEWIDDDVHQQRDDDEYLIYGAPRLMRVLENQSIRLFESN